MQHWYLTLPLAGAVTVRRPPAGTIVAPTALDTHSGAGFGFPESVLRSGTKPPPNLSTLVKVWVSPPRLGDSGTPYATRRANLRVLRDMVLGEFLGDQGEKYWEKP